MWPTRRTTLTTTNYAQKRKRRRVRTRQAESLLVLLMIIYVYTNSIGQVASFSGAGASTRLISDTNLLEPPEYQATDNETANLLGLLPDYLDVVDDEQLVDSTLVSSGLESSRQLTRRQVVVVEAGGVGGSSSSQNSLDYDSYRPVLTLSDQNNNQRQQHFPTLRRQTFPLAEPLKSPLASSSKPQDSPSYLNSNNIKMGPQFSVEPPSQLHYLNSSDLVIPCAATGNPNPSITWWHKHSQQPVEVGSLLDKRYVRYDNSLVISAFKPEEFEPEIHAATYRCQASNALGSIISRDVAINAVLEQEAEVSVADQFVTVDNDAQFRCQPSGQARDFLQVVGWLEDGQQLTGGLGQVSWLSSSVAAASGTTPATSGAPKTASDTTSQTRKRQGTSRALVLPDGQLYVQRAQLKDANKSFRCQVKSSLSGRLSLSSISGRLFVTDASESGAAPRIVDAPKPITAAKVNEQLLLTCLAQGSPRPTVRWFRQLPADATSGGGGGGANSNQDWTELLVAPSGLGSPNNGSMLANFALSADGNLLLLRSVQLADQRSRFKCLANNSYGAHQAETELRLDVWPSARLVELEPKVDFIQQHPQQQQQLDLFQPPRASETSSTFNCTVRASSQPLLGLEWLKNGRQLFSVSLSGSIQPAEYHNNHNNNSLLTTSSIFDSPNQELSLVEYYLPSSGQQESGSSAGHHFDQPDLLSDRSLPTSNWLNADEQANLANSNNFALVTSTLSELSALNQQKHYLDASLQEQLSTKQRKLWQSLRQLNRDTLLYQLHFGPLRRTDRGSYQCRARYPRTTLHSTGQLVLKDNPPQFIETFQSQLINNLQQYSSSNQQQQQQQSLKCVASGSPLPEISWTLSGFPVPESSRFRVGDYVTRDGLIVSFVNISSVQTEDGGLYECTATNDVGQLRHAAWLNVSGPAHIRPMPNVSAVAGQSLSVMCPVGGWPIEQINWFQNSSKLPLNHRQKLLPNGTLIISELNEASDSGQYSCQAKSAGSDIIAFNHVQIQIKVPPVVEPFSFARSLHRGQRYNIMCTVTRGDLPVAIRWFKDGRLIGLADHQQHHQLYQQQHQPQASDSIEGNPTSLQQQQQRHLDNADGIAIKQLDPYSSTLTFASLQSHHRGLYSCEATNAAGRAEQSSSLVIHVPPEWRIEPRDLSVTVGKMAVIDCQADGFPAARVEWRLSQDLFREPPTEFKPIISSLYMRVFENGSLIIYNTQRTDAGYYLCQANNGIGPGISRVIKLTVHVAAHFKSKIRTELVRRGQLARLKCEAIGDLPIEINWLKDKLPLYTSEEPRYSLTKTQLSDAILSELTISDTDRSDSALFTCITQNQFGTDDTNIQLVVQGPPDPPLDVRLEELEARSVKITWTPAYSGNSPLSKYVLMYAPASQPEEQQTALVQSSQQQQQQHFVNLTVGGNESTLVLQNLTPMSEYRFYLVAVNSLGASKVPSEPYKFSTADEAPNAPPLFVKAQAVSSKAIKVRWRAPDRRAHYGSINGFYVGYKVYRTPTTGGLDKQSSLQAATSAAAASGQQFSPQDTFVYKTIDYLHPSGQMMPANDSNRLPGGQIEQECLLTSLKRGQKYLITVQAFNGRGVSPASEPILAETWRFDVPEPPSLRMISRTTRSIHLAWRLASSSSGLVASSQAATNNAGTQAKAAFSRRHSIAKQDAMSPLSAQELDLASDDDLLGEQAQQNEPILGFILVRRQLANLHQPSHQQQEGQPVELRLPAEHMSQVVDDLSCGTRYQFTLAALNSVGASAPSEPLVVKTEGSPPVAPDRGSLLSLNSSSVVINLAAWHNGACEMRSFDIMFKPSRSKKWTQLTNYQIAPTGSTNNTSVGEQAQRSTAANLVASGANQPNGTITLDDLSLNLNYDLKIMATNEAGSTEALYTFNTNGNSLTSRALNGDLSDQQWTTGGEFQFMNDNGSFNELFQVGLGSFLPLLLLLLFVSLALSTGCILLARKRHSGSGSSHCSLSISSASRSNQSSSNYYTSAGGGTEANSHHKSARHEGQLVRCTGAGQMRLNELNGELSTADSPALLIDNHNNNTIRINDIYAGARPNGAAQFISGTLKSTNNYAYLNNQSGHLQAAHRPSSPHGTEITSVLNGSSEPEMCLGASALNINHQPANGGQQEAHELPGPLAATLKRFAGANTGGATNVEQPNGGAEGYYMSGGPAANSKANLVDHLGKSSTLPANCHQQLMMQQLMQQQHQEASQNQAMLDSLVAANIYQQQQQQQQQEASGGETNNSSSQAYLQAAIQASQLQAVAAAAAAAVAQQHHGLSEAHQLQLQQQVYATVKRGCPRPPRPCDYAIYQCPQQQQQQLASEQEPLMRACCANQTAANQAVASSGHPFQCYHHGQQVAETGAIPTSAMQQQQMASDYQQLRPIN